MPISERRKQERRRWPDKDHPVWTLAQSVVALIAVLILVAHPNGAHQATMPDMNDAAGLGGLALAAKLLWQQIR